MRIMLKKLFNKIFNRCNDIEESIDFEYRGVGYTLSIHPITRCGSLRQNKHNFIGFVKFKENIDYIEESKKIINELWSSDILLKSLNLKKYLYNNNEVIYIYNNRLFYSCELKDKRLSNSYSTVIDKNGWTATIEYNTIKIEYRKTEFCTLNLIQNTNKFEVTKHYISKQLSHEDYIKNLKIFEMTMHEINKYFETKEREVEEDNRKYLHGIIVELENKPHI